MTKKELEKESKQLRTIINERNQGYEHSDIVSSDITELFVNLKNLSERLLKLIEDYNHICFQESFSFAIPLTQDEQEEQESVKKEILNQIPKIQGIIAEQLLLTRHSLGQANKPCTKEQERKMNGNFADFVQKINQAEMKAEENLMDDIDVTKGFDDNISQRLVDLACNIYFYNKRFGNNSHHLLTLEEALPRAEKLPITRSEKMKNDIETSNAAIQKLEGENFSSRIFAEAPSEN